jgi:membrane-associated phospholipid phosphatase
MMLALVIACAIGVAHVFVGVHYPGDIVGGQLMDCLPRSL